MDTLLEKYPKDLLYDSMTSAYRKDVFFDVAQDWIATKRPFSLFFLDFDDFKDVNDTKGHLIGDRALIDLTRTLWENIPKDALLFRYGGDEFVLLVPNLIVYREVWEVARKYSEAVRSQHYDYLEGVFPGGRATLTSGISRYPIDADNLQQLLLLADKALYRGKSKGKNCFIIYLERLHKDIPVEPGKDRFLTIRLLNELYQDFSGRERIDGLQRASRRLGLAFSIARLSLQAGSLSRLLYQDRFMASSSYHPYPKEDFLFPKEESFQVFYRSIGEEKGLPYAKPMAQDGINTSLLFRVSTPDGEGFYRLDSRRERVFTEVELFLFQTAANLYSFSCPGAKQSSPKA